MKIAILKYNAGNTTSVAHAIHRLGFKYEITNDAKTIQSADKVIFPGVGEASSAMKYLKTHGLDLLIPTLKQPVLGICLGMQLLCKWTEENLTEGLHILPLKVKKFSSNVKVPHMGWNTIHQLQSPLFKGIPENSYVYFVHSYYVPISDFTIAQSSYETNFSAAVQKDNFFGVQFHPEKSSHIGAIILKNFLEI